MHGILLVDKPDGITSNDVVRGVKRLVKPAKVGHTGTLDPAATGLVVVTIGSATRALDYLDESRKEYKLTVRLGVETDTDDRDGKVTATSDPFAVTYEQVEDALVKYSGVVDQVPPQFAAVKKDGVPLYKLARRGIQTEIAPRKVEIYSICITGWAPPLVDLEMICSKGTYARALARDLGRDLGVGGLLQQLRRTASGSFRVERAFRLEDILAGGLQLVRENLVALPDALAHIPDIQATLAEIRKLMKGASVSVVRSRLPRPEDTPNMSRLALFKIVSGEGGLVILVRPQPDRNDMALLPARVFKMWEE
jgi:tRNA pseudouridine55 synthase